MALSVGEPRDSASRVYPGPMTGLRGILPCGVRTFLPGANAGAILRLTEIRPEARAKRMPEQAMV